MKGVTGHTLPVPSRIRPAQHSGYHRTAELKGAKRVGLAGSHHKEEHVVATKLRAVTLVHQTQYMQIANRYVVT